MARPGNCFETFLVYFLVAIDAFPEFVCLNSSQRFVDQLENCAIGVCLAEQKFFCIGIGGLVRQIDCGIIVRLAPFFLGASNVSQ